MAVNLIEHIRADIRNYFNPSAAIPETEEIHYSPDKKYFFKSTLFKQTDQTRNWDVAKIEIYKTASAEKIFEFIRSDDSTFYCWLTIDNNCYLLLSEDLEGKSILDLSNLQFYSYLFEDDKFIWAEYYPSPDNKTLAIIGCFWACANEIRVYDTSDPTNFPFKEYYRKDMSFQEEIEWVDNNTFKIVGKDGTSSFVTT